MFDLINELRAQTTSSTIYSKLTDAYDEIVLNGYFSLQDGTQIYLDQGYGQISDVKTEIEDLSGSSFTALTWSEGLTLATNDFGTYWATSSDPSTDETIPTDGD